VQGSSFLVAALLASKLLVSKQLLLFLSSYAWNGNRLDEHSLEQMLCDYLIDNSNVWVAVALLMNNIIMQCVLVC
jgi:hypothetical protein